MLDGVGICSATVFSSVVHCVSIGKYHRPNLYLLHAPLFTLVSH